MNEELTKLSNEVKVLIDALEEESFFKANQQLVIGCSTSEVLGKAIGSASSNEVAQILFEQFYALSKKHDFHVIFQGCEHINRALTMEQKTAERFGYEVVSVVPHRTAGGSLSEYAYKHFQSPVVVEHAAADQGIDIGQTLIGMQIKAVVVPYRTKVTTIGHANVTIATRRPKLIGGVRAKYNS